MKTGPCALLLLLLPVMLQAQPRKAELKRIYFNLYTDSIKTVLNYYVNVEGEYSDGRYLPLDAATIQLTADNGTISGNEWVAPKEIHFENVHFQVISKDNPKLHDQITVWLKKGKDPRDEVDEGALPYPGSEQGGRER